eukprot:1310199-Rhodomonas_salina.1
MPPAELLLRSHSQHACHGHCHCPFGTRETPAHSFVAWYTFGQNPHSISSPPSPQLKHSLSYTSFRFFPTLAPC